MPETAPPNPELLRSLGRLVRGLAALFWALPVTLVVCVQTAMVEMLRSFNILPPMVVTGWIVYGLWQLGYFQKQERVWIRALDLAKILGIVNFGFSPFLFWWNQRPGEEWFGIVIGLMAFNGLVFLYSVNVVLCRLTAMLPDEVLREETRQFTGLNRMLLIAIAVLGVIFLALLRHPTELPGPLNVLMIFAVNQLWIWLLVVLSLLPLAMTMALIWKIKEVILGSVFGEEH